MAIKHTTTKAPGQRVFAVSDWNANHTGNLNHGTELTNVTSDQHHPQLHNAVSHTDIASTGAQIDDAVSKKHDESHTIISHSDIVDATGAQIEELTGGGDTVLHDHDGISENTAARHAEAHNAASHTDISSTGAQIDDAVSKKHDRQHALNSATDHTGTITDAQHGVRAIANAHAHGHLSGIGADDHHAQSHTLASHSTKAHTELTGVTANQHHNESHNAASHSDITSTGAQIDDAVSKKHTQNIDTALGAQTQNLNMNTHKIVGLVDPTANQDAATKKYVDDNIPIPFSGDHADLTNVTSDQHHAQAHTIVSHDTTATGANLTSLTNNSMVDTLHRHSELSASDGTPDRALVVDAVGNVGIGTSGPDTKLHLHDSVNQEHRTLVLSGTWSESGDHYNLLSFKATNALNADAFLDTSGEGLKNFHLGLVSNSGFFNADRFSIIQGGVERFVIKQGGNVGIGTDSPDELLHLKGADNPTIIIEDIGSAVLTDDVGTSILFRTNDPTEGAQHKVGAIKMIGTDDWGRFFRLGLFTASGLETEAERLTILRSGNVGIGTTSPDNELTVAGDMDVTGNVGIGTTGPLSKLSIGSVGNVNYGIHVTGAPSFQGYFLGTSHGVYGYGTIYAGYFAGKIRATKGRMPTSTIHSHTVTENYIFNVLAPSLPNIGDEIIVSGGIGTGFNVVSKAKRESVSTIGVYYIANGATGVGNCVNGDNTVTPASLSW